MRGRIEWVGFLAFVVVPRAPRSLPPIGDAQALKRCVGVGIVGYDYCLSEMSHLIVITTRVQFTTIRHERCVGCPSRTGRQTHFVLPCEGARGDERIWDRFLAGLWPRCCSSCVMMLADMEENDDVYKVKEKRKLRY